MRVPNLYHLNAEEEPESEDYPTDFLKEDGRTFAESFGPRGVTRSSAVCGDNGEVDAKAKILESVGPR